MELQALLSESKQEIAECAAGPAALAGMLGMIESGAISGKMAKEILAEMFSTGKSAEDIVRERALMMFSKLRVWDTEHNNGVLIYLLLAEHAIEFVADRALSAQVDHAQWQAIVDRLGARLRSGEFEDGLTQALEEVSALLVAQFPTGDDGVSPNELPDSVVRA